MSRRPPKAEAVRWLGRRDRGFSPAEAEAFAAWLAAAPGRRQAVAEIERTWNALDRLRALAPVAAEPDPAALRPVARPAAKIVPLLFAAAAAAALTVILAHRHPAAGPRSPSQYATALGAYDRVALKDGSCVEMNEDSVVEVQFTPQERQVRLVRGEANFEVAKNPARPFVVTAGGVAVRAVGTAFDVRLAPATITVVVTEGTVRVSGGDRLFQVGAGQRLVLPTGPAAARPALAAVVPADVERSLAWDRQPLDLRETPLADLVRDFNRHHTKPVVFGDSALAAMRISGRFRLDDEAAFLRLLESTFGVGVDRTAPDQVVLRPARE